MNPFITADVSVPAQWTRPTVSRTRCPNCVITPGA
jgi:hypothetical protein